MSKPIDRGGSQRRELAALLEQNLSWLRAVVRQHMDPMLQARESSADVVQSVCRELLRRPEPFRCCGGPALREWLFRTALNKLRARRRYHLSQCRSLRREAGAVERLHEARQPSSSRADAPDVRAAGREQVILLGRCLRQLGRCDRRVILWHRVMGRSSVEIAAELGCTSGAVRTRLHRALARLTGLMQGAGAEL